MLGSELRNLNSRMLRARHLSLTLDPNLDPITGLGTSVTLII